MTIKNQKLGKNLSMREIGQSIIGAKEKVQKLVGIPVLLKINVGRGKSMLMKGEVAAIFPAVFTVRMDNGQSRTFSYSDVHTGNVLFLPRKD